MDTDSDDLFRIAHRGCHDQYPENTIAAVEAAAPHVDAVEVDLRACGTGELVVFHDETLDRVTSGTGRIDETPLAAIRELDVLGSGEPIPTLRELLDAMSALSEPPTLNVELKSSGIAPTAVSECADTDLDVLYSSFHGSVLREIRTAGPDAPIAVVFSERPDTALELADEIDAVAVHPWKGLICGTDTEAEGSDQSTLDDDLVAAAHSRDLVVNAWSVETTSEVKRLQAAGVDGVIADRCDIFGSATGSVEPGHTNASDP
ncbi:glycerophosphoryl diester phosphodiesterase [Halorubrum alkaliphilum]|uniref:Glycerophosphoryl diester phosphodiesterase n=1 Tax=Halorubrum alkaliphilum TaxID=261290 RepID=A0A8T4GE42_9EURY|nr:glycerophosphodiester phosphodiesterase family protein [Halorubrum alkaliphilum]MBP1922403.1 glycerophosphoryl diester phosphodiesterase [Halorubrum alkaliphilum]